MIQRIVGIRFVKQENQSVNDGVDVQHRLPILTQNVQTHLPLEVDVGMVNLGIAVDFGGCVRVVIGYVEFEFVGRVLPKARVRRYRNLEDGEIVGVWKFDVGDSPSIELGDICGNDKKLLTVSRPRRQDFIRKPRPAFTIERITPSDNIWPNTIILTH